MLHTKIHILGVALIIILGLFTGCVDYGYAFHFDVVGGNGEITLENENFLGRVMMCNEGQWCELECADSSRFISLMGSKKGGMLTFIAIPNEGYQVKEWLFNGKTVENNKSNSYTVRFSSKQNYNGVIAVRFEPI